MTSQSRSVSCLPMFRGSQNSIDALRRTNKRKQAQSIARGWLSYLPGQPRRPCRLRSIWSGMKYRCSTKIGGAFPIYGARGISVCAQWHDYATFRKWAVSHGYRNGLTIDRKDNDGNYEPSNCRWVTTADQNRNHRNTVMVMGRVAIHVAASNGICKATFWSRISRGMSIRKAASLPPRIYSRRS